MAVVWNPLTWDRWVVDFAVAVVHVVSIAALYVHTDYLDDHGGLLLFVMELVTIVFHLFYALSLNFGWSWGPKSDEANLFKWLEYCVSATIGAFALAWINGDPGVPSTTQILLAGAGVAQQASGFQLELDEINAPTVGVLVSWLSAAMLQAGEFAVVWLALSDGLDLYPKSSTDATWAAYSAYVLGYRRVPRCTWRGLH